MHTMFTQRISHGPLPLTISAHLLQLFNWDLGATLVCQAFIDLDSMQNHDAFLRNKRGEEDLWFTAPMHYLRRHVLYLVEPAAIRAAIRHLEERKYVLVQPGFTEDQTQYLLDVRAINHDIAQIPTGFLDNHGMKAEAAHGAK